MSNKRPTTNSVLGDRAQPLLERQPSEDALEGVVAGPPASILQRISAFAAGATEEPTVKCQVCFDDVPLSRTVALSACGHRDCRECVTLYLEVKIRDGQVYPKCFHQDDVVDPTNPLAKRTCGVRISEADIKMLVPGDIRAKYKTFRFNKENDRGRQCPYCNNLQICKGEDEPIETCAKCHKEFCFVHSNAHVGGPCAEYEKREAHGELQSRATIQRTTKPCPKCAADIEKSGGCNHLRCPTCDTNFCWLCGIELEPEDKSNHFEWWRLGSCAGLIFVDIRQDSLPRVIGAKLITLLHFLVIGPAAAVVTVAFTIATFFCLPCVCCLDMTFNTSVNACMQISMWLLFAPIALMLKALSVCKHYVLRLLPHRERRPTRRLQEEDVTDIV